jgi:heme-degrading monooxygenase HmoA
MLDTTVRDVNARRTRDSFALTLETRMFIAMNRFQIARGREDAFEEMWRNRESHLDEVEGFREFRLLKGPSGDESTLFVSHSIWNSRAEFMAWTESEAFRKAHAQARAPEGTYLGPPAFEGFDVVL